MLSMHASAKADSLAFSMSNNASHAVGPSFVADAPARDDAPPPASAPPATPDLGSGVRAAASGTDRRETMSHARWMLCNAGDLVFVVPRFAIGLRLDRPNAPSLRGWRNWSIEVRKKTGVH